MWEQSWGTGEMGLEFSLIHITVGLVPYLFLSVCKMGLERLFLCSLEVAEVGNS